MEQLVPLELTCDCFRYRPTWVREHWSVHARDWWPLEECVNGTALRAEHAGRSGSLLEKMEQHEWWVWGMAGQGIQHHEPTGWRKNGILPGTCNALWAWLWSHVFIIAEASCYIKDVGETTALKISIQFLCNVFWTKKVCKLCFDNMWFSRPLPEILINSNRKQPTTLQLKI